MKDYAVWEGIKKGKSNIAPLQLPTLATFRSWGSSAGAGRADLPGGKGNDKRETIKSELAWRE